MATQPASARPNRRVSLRGQVMAAMALGLSPLLALGSWQALKAQDTARADRYRMLEEASSDRLSRIDAALQTARMTLHLIAGLDPPPACQDIGGMLATMEFPVRNVIRFNDEGEATCSLIGDPLAFQSMPGPDWNARLADGEREIESAAFQGGAPGDPVIWFLRSTRDAAGKFSGSISFTLSLEKLAETPAGFKVPGRIEHALVTAEDGHVSGSELIQGVPAEWLSTGSANAGRTQEVEGPKGQRLDALIVPLAAEGVSLVTVAASLRRHPLETSAALFVAVLAYLAALLAASWIIDTLVLRWLERLRLRLSDMRAAGNDPPMGAELAAAPAEIRQLGKAFDALTDRGSLQASELQQALVTATAAFRETHHRIRNNLQVMLSMLKLQVRNETVPETRHALRMAAQRVSMMAAVQHSLLNETDLKTVDAVELIDAICMQIEVQQGWGEESRAIRPEVSPGLLPSDIAVPLAMFIQEAIHLICPVSDNGAIIHDFRLYFDREGEKARLTLTCGRKVAAGTQTPDDDNTSLLLAAFAHQMGGTVEQLGRDAEIIIIELVIPVESVSSSPPAART